MLITSTHCILYHFVDFNKDSIKIYILYQPLISCLLTLYKRGRVSNDVCLLQWTTAAFLQPMCLFYKWTHACCVMTETCGENLLLMNAPKPGGLQDIRWVLGRWSPVALFGSCWYPFHCWLDKCHSRIKDPCLEDLTQMGLVRWVC